jgi:hypothetical protein
MILGVSGHRPPDLGGYSEEAFQLLVEVAKIHLKEITPKAVIQGMALGWDQACATACWELGIPYGCYIPYEDQANAWPKQSRFRWASLRDHAEVERVFGEKYDDKLTLLRNKAIVDDSQKLLVNFNGYSHSGTGATVRYAQSRRKEFINVYAEWKLLREERGVGERP